MDTKLDRLFVGQKKVLWYNEVDGDVEFNLDDGSSDSVTADQFKAIAKASRYEDGMVRVYKWNKAITEIMEILLRNKMKLIEKDFVTGRIDSTIIEGYQKAVSVLFGAKFEEFINLAQIDSVLKDNNTMFNEEEVVVEGSEAEVVAEEVVAEEVAAEEVAPEAPAEEVVAE